MFGLIFTNVTFFRKWINFYEHVFYMWFSNEKKQICWYFIV